MTNTSRLRSSVESLKKIVDHPELRKHMDAINRLNTIRNYFAHCGQEMSDRGASSFYVPDPRKPAKPIDFEVLYSEFNSLAPAIEEFLFEAFKSKGGQFSDSP